MQPRAAWAAEESGRPGRAPPPGGEALATPGQRTGSLRGRRGHHRLGFSQQARLTRGADLAAPRLRQFPGSAAEGADWRALLRRPRRRCPSAPPRATAAQFHAALPGHPRPGAPAPPAEGAPPPKRAPGLDEGALGAGGFCPPQLGRRRPPLPGPGGRSHRGAAGRRLKPPGAPLAAERSARAGREKASWQGPVPPGCTCGSRGPERGQGEAAGRRPLLPGAGLPARAEPHLPQPERQPGRGKVCCDGDPGGARPAAAAAASGKTGRALPLRPLEPLSSSPEPFGLAALGTPPREWLMGLFPALFSGRPSAPLLRPASPGSSRAPLSPFPWVSGPEPSSAGRLHLGLCDPFGRLCPRGAPGPPDPHSPLQGLPLGERVRAPFGLCTLPHLP